MFTDRIIDQCILIAKYHIFTSKLQGTTPHLNAFAQNMKHRFEVEKYYSIVDPTNVTLIGYCTDHILDIVQIIFTLKLACMKMIIFVCVVCLYTIDLSNYGYFNFLRIEHCMFFFKL